MSKPRLIIHIGTNKTGTSEIQDYFHLNRELFRKNGILYPFPSDGAAAHHEIAAMIKDESAAERAKAAITDQWNGEPTIVISSEEIHGAKNPSVFLGLLEEFDVSVVLYLRDPVKYLSSWWRQDVQAGDYFGSFYSYALGNGELYSAILKRWSTDTAELKVGVYDRKLLKDGDILADFLERADISVPDGSNRKPWEANPSIGGNLLYLKMLYNSLGLPNPRTQRMVDTLLDISKIDPRFRGSPSVSAIDASTIGGRFRQDLRVISRDYGVEIPLSGATTGEPIPNVEMLKADQEAIHKEATRLKSPLLDLWKYMNF